VAERFSGAEREAMAEEDRRELLRVHEQAGVMLDLVDDMLECARLSDLERGLPREDIDLSFLARAAIAELKPEADERGVALESEIAAVPVIRGDPQGWPQVFHNLIENAVRCSPSGTAVHAGA
jgi:signal transduction histidine kinase